MTPPPPDGLLIAGAVVLFAVSPLLAAWTAALATGVTDGWWKWRPVTLRRWAAVTVTALLLGAGAVLAAPWPAWLLLAAGGAVLAVVDVQRHLLPARLVYPLAATIAATLTVTTLTTGQGDRLLRAGLAAAVVTAAWLAIAFTAPSAVGLGDVRLFALTGGMLGWVSWVGVVYAELAAFALAAAWAAAIAAIGRRRLSGHTQIPMGPAILAGAVIATWL